MKEVKLVIRIDKEGKMHVKPEGTAGAECLELMRCLESIKGFKCETTIENDDMNNFDEHINDTRYTNN